MSETRNHLGYAIKNTETGKHKGRSPNELHFFIVIGHAKADIRCYLAKSDGFAKSPAVAEAVSESYAKPSQTRLFATSL